MTTEPAGRPELGLRPKGGRFLVCGAMQGIGCAPTSRQGIHRKDHKTDPENPKHGPRAILFADQTSDRHTDYSCSLRESKPSGHHGPSTRRIGSFNQRGLIGNRIDRVANRRYKKSGRNDGN